MSSAPSAPENLTEDAYLRLEPLGEVRHEFVGGHLYSMAGASADHELIVLGLATQLRAQLRGHPCRAFAGGMRVRVETAHGSGHYYYPDVVVDSAGTKGIFAEQPVVIFEVLSPATARFDRVEKLTSYQTLPSLRVYLLVEQSRAEVIVNRRAADGRWEAQTLSPSAADLDLPEIGCRLSWAEIYEGTAVVI